MYDVTPIGWVRSSLTDREAAPRQGDEGAPPAWIVFEDAVHPAWQNIAVGDALTVVTFLHRADRSVLTVHPRGEVDRPLEGVFTTRSADRPNPIGLHDVRVLEVGADGIRVRDLEAIDGTPVLDVKPVLGSITQR